jgi:hypothetical protein
MCSVHGPSSCAQRQVSAGLGGGQLNMQGLWRRSAACKCCTAGGRPCWDWHLLEGQKSCCVGWLNPTACQGRSRPHTRSLEICSIISMSEPCSGSDRSAPGPEMIAGAPAACKPPGMPSCASPAAPKCAVVAAGPQTANTRHCPAAMQPRVFLHRGPAPMRICGRGVWRCRCAW